LVDELGLGVVEVLEEDVGVGGGAAGGGVGGDGADGFEAASTGRRCGFLTRRRMLRTWWSEAMVQPGTIARSEVRAAMGIRPRSAAPDWSSAAHAEGRV